MRYGQSTRVSAAVNGESTELISSAADCLTIAMVIRCSFEMIGAGIAPAFSVSLVDVSNVFH